MSEGKKINVGLVQIGDKFAEQYYFPYTITILQAFAESRLPDGSQYNFRLPLYKREKVKDAVRYLQPSDIVFFSAYIWNYNLSLAIAETLKKKRPQTVIVFGGPQVPQDREHLELFLRNNSFIDIASYGEGEVPFLQILENFTSADFRSVPSIGYVNRRGQFIYNQGAAAVDINEYPSPYLSGIMDRLIAAYPAEQWQALIETNRGCPYTCAFCYWGLQECRKLSLFDMQRICAEIDWISGKKIEFVFCCDGNFGLLPRDEAIVDKVSENKKRYGYPKVFSVQNTKNSTESVFTIQRKLNNAGLQKGVNLALQSLNRETLQAVNRTNISACEYSKLQNLFSKNAISTFTDLILGLPLETYTSFTEGVSTLIEGGQHNRLQFINLVVLENTLMNSAAYQKQYGLVIRETLSISHHTSLDTDAEIPEKQRLVVGSAAMPESDWLRARVFAWIASLFYFNKLFQIPLLLANKVYGVSFNEFFETIMGAGEECPVIAGIISTFFDKAKKIQNGDSEYIAAPHYLNLWWPIDEFIFIDVCKNERLGKMYQEGEKIIFKFLRQKNIDFPEALIQESLLVNQALIKLPHINSNEDITLHYNILDCYNAVLSGLPFEITEAAVSYRIDKQSQRWDSWDEWARQVVWYQTKKGAYLYPWEKNSQSN